MVGDVLDAAARVEKVHGDRVSERVNRAPLDAGGARVLREEVLDLALLARSLAAGEEVGAGVSPHAEAGAEELRCVAPQGLLPAEAVL